MLYVCLCICGLLFSLAYFLIKNILEEGMLYLFFIFYVVRCTASTFISFLIFLKDFIYLFLKREEGKDKERERNIDV